MDPDSVQDVYDYELRPREIRLVRLLPSSQWTDPIHCTLSCHFLDGPLPEYTALSYAWGRANVTDEIFLNGKPWPITVNLANALYFLRDPTKILLFWIDALCINQSNPRERAAQVRLMREIYSICDTVAVYLGDGIHHRPQKGIARRPDVARITFSNDPRDLVHIDAFWDALSAGRPLKSLFHMFCLLRILSSADLFPILITKLDGGKNDALDQILEALRMMLTSTWWQRIWVVQEMVVARSAVIQYGPFSVPWDMLVAAVPHASLLGSATSSDGAKVLAYFVRHVENFENLRKQWRSEGGAPLLSLLQHFSARQATDERDKIFALLGLVRENQRGFVEPSYVDDVPRVYRNLAVALLHRTNDVSLWRGDMARKKRRDLPSWVPDWSAVFDESDRRRAQVTCHDVSNGWEFITVRSMTAYWNRVYFGMRKLSTWFQSRETTGDLLPAQLVVAFEQYGREIASFEAAWLIIEKVLKKLEAIYQSWLARLDGSVEHITWQQLNHLRDAHVSGAVYWHFEQRVEWSLAGYYHPILELLDLILSPGHGTTEDESSLFKELYFRHRNKLQFLLRKAFRVCEQYLSLASLYAKQCSPKILEIQTLCHTLKEYCGGPEEDSGDRWVQALFWCSVAVYGEVDERQEFTTLTARPDEVPIWNLPGQVPSLPPPHRRIKLDDEIFSDPAERNNGSGPPVLSIEIMHIGRVKLVGQRLMAWSDQGSAFDTLTLWIHTSRQLPTLDREWIDHRGHVRRDISRRDRQETPMESVHEWSLRTARTLVGDMVMVSVESDAQATQATDQVAPRRLKRSDTARLLRWFERILDLCKSERREAAKVGDFLENDEMKPFDQALVLVTEGRVAFWAGDHIWRFGLGPGSMAVDDVVAIMPGGRNHMIVRPQPSVVVSEFVRAFGDEKFAVVGDCYFDASGKAVIEDHVAAPESPWPGWLPQEMLQYVPGIEKIMEGRPWKRRVLLV
ncbi:heterokaryon incompatibility protein-domain-containing protein [Echria macrotheca]|uniref:Heterokaryon incompatibility protein-domain-containing protein n=1 Tax=Echria macrotheca TaxID=438768 RepID=A0AAJ0BIE7_9PEZI|nr:heterokaryon incompatibility protein-domain-containing protein [Echria macrotheca]